MRSSGMNLLSAGVLLLAGPGMASAQVNASAAAPVTYSVTLPEPFERWDPLPSAEVAPPNIATEESSAKWWGLGIGAAVGAGTGVVMAQGMCEANEDCTGPSIGFALMGALVGGVIGIFIGSALK